MPSLHKPRLVGMAVAGLSAMLLAVTSVGSAVPAAAQSRPLVIAFEGSPRNLDPFLAYDDVSDSMILNVYDQLVTYATVKEKGQTVGTWDQFKPMLAERWTINKAKTVYTFYLRKAEFSNGDPVTAQDVVWSYVHGDNPEGTQFLLHEAGFKSIKALNSSTVQITLSHPSAMFWGIVAMYPESVVDPKVVEAHGGTGWLATHMLGSGPYMMTSYNPSTEAVFKVNPHYWGPKPPISEIILKFVPDASVRQELVETGAVGVTQDLSTLQLKSLAGNPAVVEHTFPTETVWFVNLNEKVPPFNNVMVRQALSYAVPYNSLISQVMEGYAQPMDSAVPVGMLYHTGAGFDYTYNLAEAKALLKKAGYPKGFTFTLAVDPSEPGTVQDATLIQSAFAKIGVTAKIEQMANAEYLDAQNNKTLDASFEGWESFVNDPGYHLGFLLYGPSTENASNYNDAEVNKLLNEAQFDPNTAQRASLYEQVQKIINEQAPWLDLYQAENTVVTSSTVSGYMFYPDLLIRFWTFHFAS
jgi:peptide/nickel transport system substrate-binding protein